MKTLLEKPPRPLGPRWAAGNFFVFKVERFTQPHFDNILQQMNIELEDQNGNIAYAQLPYYSRASYGIENLQHALVDSHLRYVCGIADVTSGRLYIKPVSFVIEQGGNRTMLQPYLDPKSHSDKSNFQTQNQVRSETDSLKNYITELRTTISEVCLIGLKQFGKINHWKKLVQQSENLGLKRISTLLESVITSIQSSKETNVSPIFTLIALLCLSKEMELLSQK